MIVKTGSHTMRIITGDETGLIKQVLIENKRIVSLVFPVSCSNGGANSRETMQSKEWCGLEKWEVKKTRLRL